MKYHVARNLACAGGLLLSVAGAPALAEAAPADPVVTKEAAKAPFGGPIKADGGWTLDPIMDARLRYESVDQDQIGREADAITLRLRAGIEVKTPAGVLLLAEMEGTAGIENDYNAFPFAIVDDQRRPRYSVVADPENVELNRLQIGFENKDVGMWIGRQRINLGDQRWVGSVGWRQNEQTFDAFRIKSSALGPITVDLTYSNSQRGIFGLEAEERAAYDGNFYFGNVGAKLGPVDVTAFSYLIDYDEDELVAPPAYLDTQTYGLVASAAIPVAEDFKISREDQDAFALRSQKKAAAAQASGRLAREITPVTIPQRKGDAVIVERDEHPRETTLEKLGALRAPFREGGTVTAGNASGVNDGAAALIVASEGAAKKHGLTPIARILGGATAGVPPRIMGIGPAPATKKLCARLGLKPSDFDVIELNEAFASQGIAVLRELGLTEDAPQVNPNGGAIALGHPLGMSGARISGTAALELQAGGGKLALATMCIGVGQGIALAMERV